MTNEPIHLIVNPTAGRARGGVLGELVTILRERGAEVEISRTDGPGHATALTRTAITDLGRSMVVAVGGDGTVHEVVNGMVDAESGESVAPDLTLGVVAGGSGCDFLRTFGLPHDPRRIVPYLLSDTRFPIDLGRVRYTDLDGSPSTRLFANIAECGWGADVTRRANRLPRWLGQARYATAILSTTALIKQVPTTVTVDHTTISEPMSEIVIANGQFFGGNLKVAPRALPDDGIYNVQLWRGTGAEVLRGMPKVRIGEHLGSPRIREYQSATVTVEAETPLLIEADGEVLGTTPATFDIIPTPIAMKI